MTSELPSPMKDYQMREEAIATEKAKARLSQPPDSSGYMNNQETVKRSNQKMSALKDLDEEQESLQNLETKRESQPGIEFQSFDRIGAEIDNSGEKLRKPDSSS